MLDEAKQKPDGDPGVDSPPEPEFDQEAFMEMVSEDPKKAYELVQEIGNAKLESKIMDKLAPLLKEADERKARQAVSQVFDEFFNENDDANKYLDGIKEYLLQNEMPLDDKRTLKDAYQTAKLKDLEGRKSLDDYLTDDDALEKMAGNDNFLGRLFNHTGFMDKAKSNDALKSSVIADYVSGLKGGEKPAVLTDTGGTPPATPPKDISWDEASKALASDLSR